LTLDCLGILSTEVSDVMTIWDALDLPVTSNAGSGSIRLAYLQDESMGRVNPRVWERYQETIDCLKREKFDLTGISIKGFETSPHVAVSVAYPEIASAHMELMRSSATLYDPTILALLYLGELWSGRNYLDSQRARTLLCQRFRRIISPFDVVLTPTVAAQPPLIGEPAQVEGDLPGTELSTLMRFTVPFNVVGYPAISVPAGLDSDGLPVGLQLIGSPNSDASLLKIARQVEGVLGIMPSPHDGRTT
jgi:aspartyl-tRNA(Asn)/glutamyl-tRNA(Gln) amidotransferase subunit A